MEPTLLTSRFIFRWWQSSRLPLTFATVLGLYVTWVHRASGGAATARIGLSLVEVLALYFGAALLIGLIVALFGWWATTRARAAILGFLGGAVGALILNLTLAPRVIGTSLWGFKLIAYMTVLGLMPGAYLGALFWTRHQDSDT